MEYYVHNNPGNLEYNSYLFLFMRSWYLPRAEDGSVRPDTWLKVPAVKSVGPNQSSYTMSNANLNLAAMMIISADEGLVIKASRTKPNKPLESAALLEAIGQEAIDLSKWEFDNQTTWDYASMFHKQHVKERYQQQYGGTADTYFSVASMNKVYMNIRRRVVRPCTTCGGKNKR